MQGKLFVLKCQCGAMYEPSEYELMSIEPSNHNQDRQEWNICCQSCGRGHKIRLALTHEEYDPDDIDIWEEVAHQLGKQYSSGWHDENTGGGTMVFYKNYTCKDGQERMIGANEESIGLYNLTYKQMYTELDIDMGEKCIDYTYTDYETDGVMCDLGFLNLWLTPEQIEDVRIGQWMYIKKYMVR